VTDSDNVSTEELREMPPNQRMEYVTRVTKEESDRIMDEVEASLESDEDEFDPYDPTDDLDSS